MRVFKDHYQALQLSPGASLAEVKDQYRHLALQNHPDRGGDQAAMSKINDAYITLSDPTLRAGYDQDYRAFQIPKPKSPQAPAVPEAPKPAPAPAPRTPAHHTDAVWRKRFWILAGVVGAIIIYQAGRTGSAPAKTPSAQASNLTQVQQADSEQAASLKSQYDACQNSLNQQQNQIAATNQALQTALVQGSTNYYNTMQPTQAAEVAQYNATQSRCTQLRNQYNAAADTYNRSLQ